MYKEWSFNEPKFDDLAVPDWANGQVILYLRYFKDQP